MSYHESALREFGQHIQRLIEKQNLSRKTCYAMCQQMMENSQPDLHQGAFLAALAAKGETSEEIAGVWEAIVALDTCKIEIEPDKPLVENSGTGMDALKTFNVSTAAAVVAAAGGVRMARHGARALTSTCGTVDILDALGINVECSVEHVAQSIARTGIGLFNGMSPRIHPRALFRILSQIRFGSTLNIAASLASPCRPTHGLRGVYAEPVMDKVAQIMQAIGYQRAMVVHGYDGESQKGMDEISTLGETAVQEFFPNGARESYRITPEDLGLKKSSYEKVAALGKVDQEAVRLMQVVAGMDHSACIDLVCANAGAILYLAGRAADLPSGVSAGRELILSGRAFEKLCQWVTTQCDDQGVGLQRFTAVAVRAGLHQEALTCTG
ncbi:MAG: anthranilate phosphoribosyltransferase [Desulfobacterales bacterium]|jgi:anthranilate phosphoribosyltransferase|nr:anthranilate phosphoribosyltransferase [Desulfobacterales bacterium]